MIAMTYHHAAVKDHAVIGYDKSAIATPRPDTVSVLRVDGSQTSGMEPAWLKAELERPGRSQSALARFMGVVPEIVNRIVNGRRRIQAHEADQIRAYLTGTGTGAAIPHISPKPSPTAALPVRGTVEAGSWREVTLDTDFHEPETLPAPRSLVDSGAFALRVSGPSMDRLYPAGSFVIVQPWHGGAMPVGRRVVVERTRPDGLVETTVKELVRSASGELELWPRSNHPAHQTPLALGEGEGITVTLVGLVISSYRPEA